MRTVGTLLRRMASIAALAAVAGCLETTGTDVPPTSYEDDEGEVLGSTSALVTTMPRAAANARTYVVPKGPQGWNDADGYYKYPDTSADLIQTRTYELARMGASIGWCELKWRDVDKVDTLNGQPPSAANCSGGGRTLMKLVSSGPNYCVDLEPIRKCEVMLKEMGRYGMNTTTLIYDPPDAYSSPACLATRSAEYGVQNPCIPTAAHQADLRNYVQFLAEHFNTPETGRLTDLILFNEVSHSGYFSIQGLPRRNRPGQTVDLTGRDVIEADKRQWGSEYATLMKVAADGIARAQRTDMMLWTSFNNWFSTWSIPGQGWVINNQYILDALKQDVGLTVDWGIAIHPYGDPSRYAFNSPGKLGPNPSEYVLGNLDALTTQMKNWLRGLGADPARLDDYPQTKIYASEQSLVGVRTIPSGIPAYPYKRNEKLIAEWVCRSHDEVLQNPSVIAVAHRHFQASPADQLAEQQGTWSSVGLVPAFVYGSDVADRTLQWPRNNVLVDVDGDGTADGYAMDLDQDFKADQVRLFNGTVVAVPSNRLVLDAYAATFDDSLWRAGNSHACCANFFLGCGSSQPQAAPLGMNDLQDWSTVNHYKVEGRACAPKRSEPVMIEVRSATSGALIASGPANQPTGARGPLMCDASGRVTGTGGTPCCTYSEQKYSIEFSRDQLAVNPGGTGRIYAKLRDGTSTLLGNVTMPAVPGNYNTNAGRVDELVIDSNLVTLRGWACAVGTGKSIDVHVYWSNSSSAYPMGTFLKAAHADFLSEPAVASQCGDNSSAHRFEISFTRSEVQAAQGKSLHVYGISPVGAFNDVIPRASDFKMPALSASYQVPGTVVGRVETLYYEDQRPVLKGWACWYGDSQPTTLHVYSGDSWQSPLCDPAAPVPGCLYFVKSEVADGRMDPAAKGLCGNQGDLHRFEIAFTDKEKALHANRLLHVFALRPGGQGPNPVLTSMGAFRMPINGDVPLVGDFNRDGKLNDLVIFRASDGTWWSRTPQSSTFVVSGRNWGQAGDVPLVGDFDSDGFSDDMGIFRPTTGRWYARKGSGAVIFDGVRWGEPGDEPLVGDFDADGFKDDLCVWRSRNASFYFALKDGTWMVAQADGTPVVNPFNYGLSGDTPLVGDFDRDGRIDDVMVWRPSDGWYAGRINGSIIYYYYSEANGGPGGSGDKAIVGDYSVDSRFDDFGVWSTRSSTLSTRNFSANGVLNKRDVQIPNFAQSGDMPVAGDWNSDGVVDDIAVWRPTTAMWYARRRDGTTIFNGISFGNPRSAVYGP